MPSRERQQPDKEVIREFFTATKGKENKSKICIRRLLNEEKLFLERVLEAPAPVHCGGNIVGENIIWNIRDGVDSARDVTGKRIYWEQVMFPHAILIYCLCRKNTAISNSQSDYAEVLVGDKICTARDVFESIHKLWKTYLGDSIKQLSYKGLKKVGKEEYWLLVGS
jgi:hypothetical protein